MRNKKQMENLLVVGAIILAVAVALTVNQSVFFPAGVTGQGTRNIIQGFPNQDIVLGLPNPNIILGLPNPSIVIGLPNSSFGIIQGLPNQSIVQGMPNSDIRMNGKFAPTDQQLLDCLAAHPAISDPTGAAQCLGEYQAASSEACKSVANMVQSLIKKK